ncbi:hypothetical protein BB427_11375 [Pseudoalteromonas sp. BMB]|uniref:hypothetical protein n=1 Tax=Pseudoalteromonas sp. BMB TaxID=1874619 RepID=UPI00083E221F|nr:hypothetical protein [Pseudoalteromonas sp. BMB]ODB41085.1 hypothetical protein BB427_11375 [Pseudoalteromonas sp. BMB]
MSQYIVEVDQLIDPNENPEHWQRQARKIREIYNEAKSRFPNPMPKVQPKQEVNIPRIHGNSPLQGLAYARILAKKGCI